MGWVCLRCITAGCLLQDTSQTRCGVLPRAAVPHSAASESEMQERSTQLPAVLQALAGAHRQKELTLAGAARLQQVQRVLSLAGCLEAQVA